jgi:hypothetical protein
MSYGYSGYGFGAVTYIPPSQRTAAPVDWAAVEARIAALCKSCAGVPASGENPSGDEVCALMTGMLPLAKAQGSTPDLSVLDELAKAMPCIGGGVPAGGDKVELAPWVAEATAKAKAETAKCLAAGGTVSSGKGQFKCLLPTVSLFPQLVNKPKTPPSPPKNDAPLWTAPVRGIASVLEAVGVNGIFAIPITGALAGALVGGLIGKSSEKVGAGMAIGAVLGGVGISAAVAYSFKDMKF